MEENVINRIRSLIHANRGMLQDDLSLKIVKEKAEHAQRGMVRSSVMSQSLSRLIEKELEARTKFLLQTIQRVFKELGVGFEDSLGIDLKNVVHILFEEDRKELSERLAKELHWVPPERLSIEIASGRIRQWIDAELDLYVETLKKEQGKAPTPSHSVFHINAPVGAVQTGPGSISNVVQNIDSTQRNDLLDALRNLKEELIHTMDASSNTKEEMLVLIEESENELRKENPKLPVLKSLLGSVAVIIQTIGSLQPAYQTMKSAFDSFVTMMSNL